MAGDLPDKPPVNSASRQMSAAMRRKERLAAELRANLKRRKAATRRHKEDVVGGEDAGQHADEGRGPGDRGDEREA